MNLSQEPFEIPDVSIGDRQLVKFPMNCAGGMQQGRKVVGVHDGSQFFARHGLLVKCASIMTDGCGYGESGTQMAHGKIDLSELAAELCNLRSPHAFSDDFDPVCPNGAKC